MGIINMRRRRVFFGLGSNIGDRLFELERAIKMLPDVARVSGVYETEPIGGPEQDPYYNCVVESLTELSARQLLETAQVCESAAMRLRTVRNGPRTLDVDLLMIEGETIDEPDLVVPHPRMYERRFVIEPLAELAPELIDNERALHASGGVQRLDVCLPNSAVESPIGE